MQPTVYIMASGKHGTLYVGCTRALVSRVWKHRTGFYEGFTKRYGVHRLVYYERHECMREAIRRERQIKEWKRAWKIALIETMNPEWDDLWPNLS